MVLDAATLGAYGVLFAVVVKGYLDVKNQREARAERQAADAERREAERDAQLAREDAARKLAENTVITEQTRQLADGRLSKMVEKVDELTGKLATSESNVARLVATEVGKASTDVLMRAQDVVAKAEITAAALIQKAEERATALIAEALRVAPRGRGQ